MRWARFESDGAISFGIVEDSVVEIVEGNPFDGHRRTGERHSFDTITWLPPVVPPTFYCVGLNYLEHLKMSAARRGEEAVLPAKPDVGYRAVNALVGHGAPIVLPPGATERVQYEGELARLRHEVPAPARHPCQARGYGDGHAYRARRATGMSKRTCAHVNKAWRR